MDIGALITCIVGCIVGGITTTGSIVAFLKLNGNLGAAPLNLPFRDGLNVAMLCICVALGATVVSTVTTSAAGGIFDSANIGLNIGSSADLVLHSGAEAVVGGPAVLALVGVALMSGVLGAHLTASVGGADMPVIITVLNSYSGWALCAEGFLLSNPLLTSVGALIGFSGAILTKQMCDAMNRNILTVILGGAGGASPAPSTSTVNPSREMMTFSTVDVDTTATALLAAKRVIIVPGYGMAVAKAQIALAEVTVHPYGITFTKYFEVASHISNRF